MFDFLTDLKPEIWVMGGTTLVAVIVSIGSILKDRSIFKIMTNHLKHDADDRQAENESRNKLSSVLQQLIDKIDKNE